MKIAVFSSKGGVGTSCVAVQIAIALSDFGPTRLIDASNGDLDVLLTLENKENPFGLIDWLESDDPDIDSLNKISLPLKSNLSFVSHISQREKQDKSINLKSLKALFDSDQNFVFDCGLVNNNLQKEIASQSDLVITVIRRCYLNLYSLMNHELIDSINAAVIISESGRAITVKQIANSVKVSKLIEVQARQDYANLFDSGKIISQSPKTLINTYKRYLKDLSINPSDIRSKDIFADTRISNTRNFWDPDEEHISKFVDSDYFSFIKSKLK